MKRYYWSGISDDDRIHAIHEITGIINRYATIINFQKFSHISLNLLLQLEGHKLNDLKANLENIMSIDETDVTESKGDCRVLINITFTEGTGDLVIEVLNIPEQHKFYFK